jgi:hypothetical protein
LLTWLEHEGARAPGGVGRTGRRKIAHGDGDGLPATRGGAAARAKRDAAQRGVEVRGGAVGDEEASSSPLPSANARPAADTRRSVPRAAPPRTSSRSCSGSPTSRQNRRRRRPKLVKAKGAGVGGRARRASGPETGGGQSPRRGGPASRALKVSLVYVWHAQCSCGYDAAIPR